MYYSHSVIVQKTAEMFRFSIDNRFLNKCTEASSFPLPNIRALLERIGHYRPDTFGVMDLTSGYHQAPMDAPFKVLTAFICYSGVYQITRLPFDPRRAPCARGHEEFLERWTSLPTFVDLAYSSKQKKNVDLVSNKSTMWVAKYPIKAFLCLKKRLRAFWNFPNP